MASSKDHFEPDHFEANHFAMGHFRGLGVDAAILGGGCLVQAQIFVPGLFISDINIPGLAEGELNIPGLSQGEEFC